MDNLSGREKEIVKLRFGLFGTREKLKRSCRYARDLTVLYIKA